MESQSKIIVQKVNINYPADNFYNAGIVESRTATQKLSHNIAKRWRIDETSARMRSAGLEVLSTRRETRVEMPERARLSSSYMYF